MDLQKEREAFEGVFPCSTGTVLSEYGHYESQVNQQDAIIQNISWVVWQAAKAQAVPEGFVVVPKEPTQELLNKMQDFFVGAFENGLTGGQSIHCAYKAMIEAWESANE